jgi:hypothetical protein
LQPIPSDGPEAADGHQLETPIKWWAKFLKNCDASNVRVEGELTSRISVAMQLRNWFGSFGIVVQRIAP